MKYGYGMKNLSNSIVKGLVLSSLFSPKGNSPHMVCYSPRGVLNILV